MISPLQLGLIALAAVFILGLLIVNWWQERAIRRDMAHRFDGPVEDVLMGRAAEQEAAAIPAFYEPEPEPEPEFVFPEPEPFPEPEEVEPEFTVAEDIEAEEEAVAEEELEIEESSEPEPEIESDVESLPAPILADDDIGINPEEIPKFAPRIASALPDGLDSQIDTIVIFTPDVICSGSEILTQLSLQSSFSKPVRWFGLTDDAWVSLSSEHAQFSFSRVVGALQLVDRGGALRADDWNAFRAQAEKLTETIGGTLSWPEERETLSYAKMLDEFCIEVDLMMTLHLTAGSEGAFPGTKLRGLAEAAGLVLKEDGRFHQLNDEGETLYVLADSSQRPMREESLRTAMLYDLVLMLDVPRIANGDNVFRQMAVFGDRLESALRAKLTDANQRPVGEAGIEAIRKQIQGIYAKMRERGINPGSPTALRLFS
ncbi:MAG: cell division protein ZipA C-terminal FtsZ-binding domain-containing protein [Methylophilales bacterium]|nr:cell division protein ZipA C-terminal FtsZ-binding domain-containing protein [Methylophilales bacterium]